MRLAEIERRLSSMEELKRIIGAMRAMASMRVREAQQALASVRTYGAALERAVREALAIATEEARGAIAEARDAQSSGPDAHRVPAHRVIIVCTSEHGFVGGFNERLLAAAEAARDSHPRGDVSAAVPDEGEAHRDCVDALWVLGSRGGALSEERGPRMDWSHPMATRLAGIPQVIRRLQIELEARIARGELARLEVIFGRSERSGAAHIERQRLFPLELRAERPRTGPSPLHGLPPQRLLELLTAQYLIARLTEAAVESLASENGARFAAMEAAHDSVSRKLGELHLKASRARQEEVTAELLELATGELAVRGESRSGAMRNRTETGGA